MQNDSKKSTVEKSGQSGSRLLTRDEVADLYGLSKRWLEVVATKGKGPPLVRISARMVRYRVCDIEHWIEAQVTDRSSNVKPSHKAGC